MLPSIPWTQAQWGPEIARVRARLEPARQAWHRQNTVSQLSLGGRPRHSSESSPLLSTSPTQHSDTSNNMAASRASTTMLLPPTGSIPPSIRDKAKNDAKDYQHVIEASLRGSSSPEFQYVLQELIGKGSYGRVYLAKDKKTNRQVAIKIINIEALDCNAHSKPLGLEDAQKEIDILARLRDFPTINVNVFVEAFPAHEHLCIVSEYCSGGSLTTLRRATPGNRLDEKYIRPVARELAFALRSVHAAGIVHRDVKCSNVMVDENGKIQLIDFGVAGIVMTNMPEDKRKTVIGTPHWMPPELQWDKQEIAHGFEVDVWAYGITLYECAMGQPPNANLINPRQLRQIIRKNPVRLPEDRFTPELCDLIKFVLEPDPTQRPTMDQVCQHPYVLGTEAAYPAVNLKDLVKQYCQWESQGGVRHSLWMAGGAEKVDINQNQANQRQDRDDGWNFASTDAFRRRMSQIDPSFNYAYDPFSPSIPEETTLSSSPPLDDDAFEEPWTTVNSTTRSDPIETPTVASFDLPRTGANENIQSTGRAERGAKHLLNLFDPDGPEYQYTYGKSSDLPLRQGGEASLHRQELSVSSNNGRGPTINLEDVSNKKRATMAWTWNIGLDTSQQTEISRRESDFFADLPTSHQATSRQSDFFSDLAPPARPALDRAATMPVGNEMNDNRASTLDLDALLGASSYNTANTSTSNRFAGQSATGHSFQFPGNSQSNQTTSYGGSTMGSFHDSFHEEPLDSFEAEMSATAEVNNYTMRPATHQDSDRRGHIATTGQLPADLISSPAESSFDDVTRDLPAISQFSGSFDMSRTNGNGHAGVAGWSSSARTPPWIDNGATDRGLTSAIPGISMATFNGGVSQNLTDPTQFSPIKPPELRFPEALDARAAPDVLEQALSFQMTQAISLLGSLGQLVNTVFDDEMSRINQLYPGEIDTDSDDEEDEDAGYDGGQEYVDGTETEDGEGSVVRNGADHGAEESPQSS